MKQTVFTIVNMAILVGITFGIAWWQNVPADDVVGWVSLGAIASLAGRVDVMKW